MLNTMMENENTGFANISIPFLRSFSSMAKHNTTNKQTAPDYSTATAIMLVIFWTERDFCIISDCRN